MTVRRHINLSFVGAILISATLVWATPASAQYGALDGEWRFYGGDGGHTQYTALDQIDAGNVGDLEVAWRWTAANSSGPRKLDDNPFGRKAAGIYLYLEPFAIPPVEGPLFQITLDRA